MTSAPDLNAISEPGPTLNPPLSPSSSTGSDSPPTAGRLASVIRRQREAAQTNGEPTVLAASMPSLPRPPVPSTGRPHCAEHDRGLAESRQAREQLDRRQRVLAANLPDLHAAAGPSLAAMAVGEWREIYLDLVGRLTDGWFHALVGPRGTGKTQLAVCVAQAALRQDMSVRYWRALDLFRDARACFGDARRSELEWADNLTNVGLLIIDEAHERGHTDYEDRTLGNILDRRYGRRAPTLLLSNATPKEFERQVGQSVVDRMRQCGGIIEMTGESFRVPR